MIQGILSSLKGYAHRHRVPIMDDPTRQYLESLLLDLRPKYCLEIGSAIGYSSLIIGQKIHTRGGLLHSCEVSFPSYMVAIYHIYLTSLSNIVLTYGDFIKFPTTYYHNTFDFVFIDGQKNQYLDYYLKLQEHIHDQTVLVFDDVIAYADKIAPLMTYLDTHTIPYTIHPLSETDGVLTIGI